MIFLCVSFQASLTVSNMVLDLPTVNIINKNNESSDKPIIADNFGFGDDGIEAVGCSGDS